MKRLLSSTSYKPFASALLLALALTSGISTGSAKPKPTPPPIFFPAPPDEPRIQFLTSFSDEEHFGQIGGKRDFFNFIVGADKVARPIVKPYGVTTIPGKAFVCDTGIRAVEVCDFTKRSLRYFKPIGDATLQMPINIAVDADGTRYITDTKRCQVFVFKEDNYVGAIGAKGEMKPCGVALQGNKIYVTDLQNHCIRAYEKGSNKLAFTFPKDGCPAPEKLFSPTNIATGPGGKLWVSDTGGFFVNVYNPDGTFVRKIGEQGMSVGKFAMPKGIAVDKESRCYVADASIQLVQVFDSEGKVLMYFGDPKSNGGGATSLPAGLAIDYDNVQYFEKFAAPNFALEYVIYVINQTGGHRVSVFGFGHRK